MKKIFITLSFIYLSLISYAQAGSAGQNLVNQTVTFTQRDKFLFFLPDQISLNTIPPLDIVSLEPHERKSLYKYVWTNNQFSHYEVRNETILQNNDHYTIPTHWARYENGLVRHIADNNSILSIDTLNIAVTDSVWRRISPKETLPAFSIDNTFSFIPFLSSGEISGLQSQGFTITSSTNYLKINSDSAYTEINGNDHTITEEYYNYNNEKTKLITYYSLSNDYLSKSKEVRLTYRHLDNGTCFMEMRTRYYDDIVIIPETSIDERSIKISAQLPLTSQIEVFPNPFSESFTVTLPEKLMYSDIKSIKVVDLTGKSVGFNIASTSSNYFKLNISSDYQGMLLINLVINGESVTKKINKQ